MFPTKWKTYLNSIYGKIGKHKSLIQSLYDLGLISKQAYLNGSLDIAKIIGEPRNPSSLYNRQILEISQEINQLSGVPKEYLEKTSNPQDEEPLPKLTDFLEEGSRIHKKIEETWKWTNNFTPPTDLLPYGFETSFIDRQDLDVIGNISGVGSGVSINSIVNTVFHNGERYLQESVFRERIKEYRSKHPEDLDCLDKMFKKAYPDS